MRAHVVDPSGYTRPYDHGLCTALARSGLEVELITSAFVHGEPAPPLGYELREVFYRHALGAPGSALRTASKLAEHVPDMLRYRRTARVADIVHFQWLPVQSLDVRLLPARPTVITAHDLLPREPRPGQVRAQRRLYDAADAVIAHSAYGRGQLVDAVGVDPAKVHVVHHGAFEHLVVDGTALPAELRRVEAPVVLFFGLMRPYKGLEVLLEAWRGLAAGPELWIVGRPLMSLEPLRAGAPAGVRFVPRYVSDAELPAYFRRADLVVLPYTRTERFDFSGVLATALAFGKPVVASDIGGFSEVGALRLVPPDDADALREALGGLLDDASERERLATATRAAAAGPYSWEEAARGTIEVYRGLLQP